MKGRILCLLLTVLIFLSFLLSLTNLEKSRQEEGRKQLEEAVRRCTIACYATEGFYPPDTAYLQEHYGLIYDEEHYIIHYQILASNLMPDITVLVRK